MKTIAIQKPMIIPTSKIILDAIFGPDAIKVWCAASFLWLISKITVTDSMAYVAFGSSLLAFGAGFFGVLRMIENWLEARAKRRLAEHKLEESEDEEKDNVVKLKNTK